MLARPRVLHNSRSVRPTAGVSTLRVLLVIRPCESRTRTPRCLTVLQPQLLCVVIVLRKVVCPPLQSVSQNACMLRYLFERSEFLIATSKKKKTDRLCVWMFD